MRVLFATARNPHFATITEYIERALGWLGHDLSGFDDRSFVFPGRVREALPLLARFDLSLLNRRLRQAAQRQRPDLLLCAGGERILPETVEAARAAGTRTVLWTIDAVKACDPRISLAPHFDFVFCGGSEMIEALQRMPLRHEPHWLPFACDPELHRPIALTPAEQARYACDLAFVGSLHPALYPNRLATLETLADLDLGVWGPGARALPRSSLVFPKVRGDAAGFEEWTRIYTAAKIALCAHYGGPGSRSKQASPRVYEALACGSFLLCDDQPDVQALFEDGRELAIFRSLGELREKALYYLDHDQERRAIAARGREKVLAEHTYRHRLALLMTTVTGATWEPLTR